jgi:hypothetical protein
LIVKAINLLYKSGISIYEHRTEININVAHSINKEYMHKASTTLLHVRSRSWYFLYFGLVVSFILMYPTPLLVTFKRLFPESEEEIDRNIFWFFWSGLYISPRDIYNIYKKAPLYYLLGLLVLEKLFQRWQTNRFGCTYYKIRQFKTLEEKVKLIKEGKEIPQEHFELADYPEKVPRSVCITVGEAFYECERIEAIYRPVDKLQKLKSNIVTGIKRKYTIQMRSAMKLVLEQLSLLFLLLSCCAKSNIISFIYLFIVLIFLRIQDKTKGMLYMAIIIGISLCLEYILMVTNLTSLNSPMPFPYHFSPYPTAVHTKEIYAVPWFLKYDFLKNNLEWTMYLGINIEYASINDIWFDFFNLLLLSVYFFSYGNPINT